MTDTTIATRPRLPVTAFFTASLFFSGVTYASTLPYGAIVGIETLGLSNATYALILMAGSLVSAAAAVALGWLSDRVPDRRIIVIGCALMGALGWGLLFLFRSPIAFIAAVCLIMPFGGALFSQSFSFARSYYDRHRPDRAEFMMSMLRTVFTAAWAIVPPIAGWVAAVSGVLEVYGIGAAAYLACAAIYTTLLAEPSAKVGRTQTVDTPGAVPERMQIELPVIGGLVGVTMIVVATVLNGVTTPLVIVITLGGTLADVGIYAGLAAALEVPFMIMWGFLARRIAKHTIIVIVAVLYAVYLLLLSRAGSVAEVLWLQPLNGITTAALLSVPIAYMQAAIKGRVGLSTSLLDVTWVTASLAAAAIFGAATAATPPSYPLVLLIAAGIATAGAVVVFTAHRLLKTVPA